MTDPLIATRYRLDGVHHDDRRSQWPANARPAGRIREASGRGWTGLLLTKTDLVEPDVVAALTQRLKALNPSAPIIQTINGAADPAKLLDAGLYNPKTKSLDVRRWLNAEAFNDAEHHHHDTHYEAHDAHDHGHDVRHEADHHGHHHDVNRHDDHIRALCLTLDDPIPGDTFDRWLDALMLLKGPDILRVKGIVQYPRSRRPVSCFHGVQHIFHPPVILKKWPGEDRRTRIVFIARDLDESALRDTLGMFTANPKNKGQPAQPFWFSRRRASRCGPVGGTGT